MRAFVLVIGAVVLAACASGGARSDAASMRCAPIVADSLISGVPVYPACGVTREARVVSTPMRPQYTPPAGLTCVSAVVEVVVDAKGNVIPRTARVVRASDPSLGSAMLAALPNLRYDPATRDGAAVAQLTSIGWTMTLQAGPAATAPARRATRPRC